MNKEVLRGRLGLFRKLLGVGLLLAGLSTQAQTPLSGAYTINSAAPTAGTNFASFTDAATRLNADGVSGPVTLTVSGGPYIEQFLLNQVPGTSATNTVVVNGGGRLLQFGSGNTNQRAVVQLNGTDYTTINNLVIDATGGATGATYGYGVLLTNAADNDRITNCNIDANTSTSSTNYAGIAVNGSTSSAAITGNAANNLVIEGNTINGGYYGITLFGASTTALNTGNVVRNNNIRDFYFYGIYTGYQDGAQFVGNDISRPLRTNPSSFYGLYTFGNSRGQAIEKNRLHDPFTGNPASANVVYGIYIVTSTGATAALPNDVVNNTFYNMNGNGLQYLIYNSAAVYSRIYNNTLLSDDQTATTAAVTYGIYNTGTNTDIRNNIVSISRTGAGLKYGLYYTVATTSNYNDLYVPTGSVGYYNATFATLANWQAANNSAFDQNSVSTEPAFAGPRTGNLRPDNVLLNNAGTPLARVTEDITGATRGALPDLGAYEFTPVTLDLAPASLASPLPTTQCFSSAENVAVQVRNAGTAALNFTTNPATVTVVATRPSGTTQTFTGNLIAGTLASGATISVLAGNIDMTAIGTYSFAVTATVAGDLNATNNTLPVAPTRTAIVPLAGTLAAGTTTFCASGTAALNLTGAAGGNTLYQSSPDNVTFTDIPTATAATYTTPALSSTTYYRVRSTCNTNTVFSNVVTVTVNNPVLTSAPSPVSTCAGSPATLSALTPAGTSVRYFTAATGGTAVGTGSPFVTPAVSTNTTFYAAPFVSTTSVAGLADNSATNGTFALSTFTDYALGFAVSQAGVLASVDVYPTAAVSLTIRLFSVSGSQPAGNTTAVPNSDVSIVVTAAQVGTRVTVPLNYTLAPGEYKLATTVGGLGRYSTYNGAYPLTSPSGILTVRGSYTTSLSVSYANTTYNSFFNLNFRTECAGATRTPIQVNVLPAPTATLTATPQGNGSVLLTAGPIAGSGTYQFYLNGVAIGPASPNNTLLLQSGTQNGNYTVVVTVGGCASAPSPAVAVVVTATRTATLDGVSLLVYPNPTPTGTLTVELTGPRAKASQLTVVNSLGQVVQTGTVPAGTATLRLGDLAAGVYTLRVQTAEGVLTQRVVRE